MVHEAQKAGLIYHVMSPAPWFYEKQLGDGGKLIVSRYPIIDWDFHQFEANAVLADVFCKKGLLYARIDLGEGCLHVFNTHTQATESELDVDTHALTFVTRYEQIKEIQRVIKRLVFD